MEDRPIIVTLDGAVNEAASFSDAFGEYSNAGGRRVRRMKRKESRQDRKMQRTDNKIEKKQRRMDNRQKRGSVFGNIVTGGALGMSKNLFKKRKKRGSEQPQDEQIQEQSQDMGQDTGGQDYQDTQSQYKPEKPSSDASQYEAPQPQYQRPQPQYSEREEDYQEEPQNEPQYEEQEEPQYRPQPRYQKEEEQESNQDEDGYDKGGYDEETDSFEGAGGDNSVDPNLKSLVASIVNFQNGIKKLEAKRAFLGEKLKSGKGGLNSARYSSELKFITEKIANATEKLDQLKADLVDYSKINKVTKEEVFQVRTIVLQEKSGMAQAVVAPLTAQSSKILIEKKSGADGENVDVHGQSTVVELTSNLEGDKKKINYTAWAIGLGIGALAIFLINKSKVLK